MWKWFQIVYVANFNFAINKLRKEKYEFTMFMCKRRRTTYEPCCYSLSYISLFLIAMVLSRGMERKVRLLFEEKRRHKYLQHSVCTLQTRVEGFIIYPNMMRQNRQSKWPYKGNTARISIAKSLPNHSTTKHLHSLTSY